MSYIPHCRRTYLGLGTMGFTARLRMIVTNEERFLGQCLASVRDIDDELIVIDTGSTDRTVEIVQEHGAQVGHFKWCNDFAAARNASIALAPVASKVNDTGQDPGWRGYRRLDLISRRRCR